MGALDRTTDRPRMVRSHSILYLFEQVVKSKASHTDSIDAVSSSISGILDLSLLLGSPLPWLTSVYDVYQPILRPSGVASHSIEPGYCGPILHLCRLEGIAELDEWRRTHGLHKQRLPVDANELLSV